MAAYEVLHVDLGVVIALFKYDDSMEVPLRCHVFRRIITCTLDFQAKCFSGVGTLDFR